MNVDRNYLGLCAQCRRGIGALGKTYGLIRLLLGEGGGCQKEDNEDEHDVQKGGDVYNLLAGFLCFDFHGLERFNKKKLCGGSSLGGNFLSFVRGLGRGFSLWASW